MFIFQSGARINISDGSSPERIVTITGNTNGIIKAFDLICRKLEEVYVSGGVSIDTVCKTSQFLSSPYAYYNMDLASLVHAPF